MLDEVQVKCQFENCREIVSKCNLKSHMESCPFRTASCSGDECSFISTHQEVKKHMLECRNVKWKCKYSRLGCTFKGQKQVVLEHELEGCRFLPRVCPGCSHNFTIESLSQHKLNCGELVINCKDCAFQMKRKQQRDHKCVEAIFQALGVTKHNFWEKADLFYANQAKYVAIQIYI